LPHERQADSREHAPSQPIISPNNNDHKKKIPILAPYNHSSERHLVLVAGHAIYTYDNYHNKSLYKDEAWYLESFQHGQVSTYINHIKLGVEYAAQDPNAILIFSGLFICIRVLAIRIPKILYIPIFPLFLLLISSDHIPAFHNEYFDTLNNIIYVCLKIQKLTFSF